MILCIDFGDNLLIVFWTICNSVKERCDIKSVKIFTAYDVWWQAMEICCFFLWIPCDTFQVRWENSCLSSGMRRVCATYSKPQRSQSTAPPTFWGCIEFGPVGHLLKGHENMGATIITSFRNITWHQMETFQAVGIPMPFFQQDNTCPHSQGHSCLLW